MPPTSDNPRMQGETTKTSSDGRRQFKLTRRIGLGGFGEVYLAEMSTSLGFTKTVALKLLRSDVEGAGDNARRMRDEARLLGLLRHRAIVQADDLITVDGRTAVVMEYIPGANLSDILDPARFPHPVPIGLGLEVVAELADAMDAAWSRPSEITGKPLEVLHRDIKPGNVRITPDGTVKILDFGIARADQMDRETATRDYAVGSLPYMAPELLIGKGASPASDMYALGVTLLEVMGRKRFGIAQDTEDGHLARVEERLAELELEALASHRDSLVSLIREMLAFEPSQRAEARDVAAQMRALLHAIHLPSLQSWSREWISQVKSSGSQEPRESLSRDDLSGRIFFEDTAAKATTWDSDTLGVDSESIGSADPPPATDSSWIWKTALIGLLGLIAVLGYRLLEDDDPPIPVVTQQYEEAGRKDSRGSAPPEIGATTAADLNSSDKAVGATTTDGSGSQSMDAESNGQLAPNRSDTDSAKETTKVVAGATEDDRNGLETGASSVEPNGPTSSAQDPPPVVSESSNVTPTEGVSDAPAKIETGLVETVETRLPEPPKAVKVKIQSVPRGEAFAIDGKSQWDGQALQAPWAIHLTKGSHTLTCDPQGHAFSATIVVEDEGQTWRCDMENRVIQER